MSPLTRKPLVLVVEDDTALRQMFRVALLLDGFEVREAADGYEALAILEQHPPDLVVLDLGLPRVSGLFVHAEIASRSATKDVPVVIVTASDVDLTNVSAACILRKPVTPDKLLATVRGCLEHSH
jgi:two-component system, OmpR family, phosphate regulon response regulator PhoB